MFSIVQLILVSIQVSPWFFVSFKTKVTCQCHAYIFQLCWMSVIEYCHQKRWIEVHPYIFSSGIESSHKNSWIKFEIILRTFRSHSQKCVRNKLEGGLALAERTHGYFLFFCTRQVIHCRKHFWRRINRYDVFLTIIVHTSLVLLGDTLSSRHTVHSEWSESNSLMGKHIECNSTSNY